MTRPFARSDRPARRRRALVAAVVAVLFGAAALLATTTVTVRPGDTVAKLASQNNTSVRAIVDANGLRDPDAIVAGQKLVIPAAAATGAAATGAASSPSTPTTAAPANTTPGRVPPAPADMIPKDANPNGTNRGALTVTTYYVVQPNDSFASIAARFGMSARRLAAANGLFGTEPLLAGQLLRIP